MTVATITDTGLNTAIIVAVALIVGLFTLIRGRADVWKSNYEGEKARADDAVQENTKLKVRIAELESQPDMKKMYQLIAQHDKDSAAQNLKIVETLDKLTRKIEKM